MGIDNSNFKCRICKIANYTSYYHKWFHKYSKWITFCYRNPSQKAIQMLRKICRLCLGGVPRLGAFIQRNGLRASRVFRNRILVGTQRQYIQISVVFRMKERTSQRILHSKCPKFIIHISKISKLYIFCVSRAIWVLHIYFSNIYGASTQFSKLISSKSNLNHNRQIRSEKIGVRMQNRLQWRRTL